MTSSRISTDASGLDRREFLAGSSAIAASVLLPKGAYAADIHRLRHGSFDISVVSDGFIMLPVSIVLPDATPEERPDIMRRLGGTPERAPFHTNIPVIRTGGDLIVVDDGSGNHFQESAGKLRANLLAAGIDPGLVTKVVLTHAHPDHAGGTLGVDGKLTFPNAQYFVSEAEWQFWTDPNFEKVMPQALHGFAKGAQRDLFAVQDRLTLVKPGDEIVSGMQVFDTRGHTPGHISLQLAGGDGAGHDGLVITGDAVTSNVVFFEHPDWHFGFDMDAELALKNRKALIDRAASERLALLGYHWAHPGIGRAERNGSAYRFVAAL
ncbi:MBL fold metallo-hydrolase [Ensifer sp. ENS10]|jgi:glyoxylase-like metal-dependent hydrolase (beta-lactamase superfamily II)|uniref:MBL fold metallo-hydrolase n=1 Tax=unclassified Ensifer TaxID=2633371 RepID=UPI00177CE983|nr:MULTISPECIES: MBL fold metallo-hydrolase [unclassified Ensifer]MBD9506947.1 MBL fold metallo-hydrolase [Ensifer sp. ENS10]MBV7517179.1 MBL fold metallo-hydrolase [Ensifer sp. ENS12]